MRLSDAQLKEGFLHSSRIVRDAVASYFANSFTRDPEVTRYVMRGVEQFGWQEFLTCSHRVSEFPIADDASMEWLCQQLKAPENAGEQDSMIVPVRFHLAKMLRTAEIGLLESHDLVLRADELKLDERTRESIFRRLECSEIDPEASAHRRC